MPPGPGGGRGVDVVMGIALICIAAFMAYGAVMTISQVNQPRKAIGPSMAAWITVVNAAIIVLVLMAAVRLGV